MTEERTQLYDAQQMRDPFSDITKSYQEILARLPPVEEILDALRQACDESKIEMTQANASGNPYLPTINLLLSPYLPPLIPFSLDTPPLNVSSSITLPPSYFVIENQPYDQ